MKKTRIYKNTAAKLAIQTRESSNGKMVFEPEEREKVSNQTFLLHRRKKQSVINEITKMINEYYDELDPDNYKSVVCLNYMKRVKISL